jgi:hypothetical protein
MDYTETFEIALARTAAHAFDAPDDGPGLALIVERPLRFSQNPILVHASPGDFSISPVVPRDRDAELTIDGAERLAAALAVMAAAARDAMDNSVEAPA